MSSEGAAQSPQGAPRELPRSFLRAEMELGEAQKSSPEALKSFEIDLKIENLDFHETIENQLKSLIFEPRRPVGSSDLLLRGSKAERKGDQRSNTQAERKEKQQDATKRAPRSSRRARKSRFVGPGERL